MLQVENLQFAYGDAPVLQGLTFEADAGELICLLGENGAGKTTFFRVVLGLQNGYKGRIFIKGKELNSFSHRELSQVMAYIPQAHTPTFNYSVFEVVLMGTSSSLKTFETPGEQEQELVFSVLEQVGITHLAGRGCSEISGGERQLMLIARALAQRSRILVMDEPTANLDYGNQYRVLAKIKQLTQQGYLVLLSSHNPEHALRFASRVLVMKDGVNAACGPPASVLTSKMLESIYHIPVEIGSVRRGNKEVPVCAPFLNEE